MKVPQHLWNLLPERAAYLRNLSQYAGYETPDSVAKLSDDGELNKVFEFMKSISEIVENKEEVYGIFHKNPQKLTLLPGLLVKGLLKISGVRDKYLKQKLFQDLTFI